ncbi:hypothetical protein C4D60_Mb03t00830 [Musa balbisiana]|uniref:Uncharacterized protein n=1 Tax=Musa balbisiana TaxID=52838 RepID=A0A4S8J8B0_MUSBA|nr:hypothetical protein C4D60_Mb03t00830 [Musa balbisiana]
MTGGTTNWWKCVPGGAHRCSLSDSHFPTIHVCSNTCSHPLLSRNHHQQQKLTEIERNGSSQLRCSPCQEHLFHIHGDLVEDDGCRQSVAMDNSNSQIRMLANEQRATTIK